MCKVSFTKNTLCLALITTMTLSGCSGVPFKATMREPAGVVVSTPEGISVGTTPLVFDVKCGIDVGTGILLSITVIGLPVALMSTQPKTKYHMIFDKNSLSKAGFSSSETEEIMKTGNLILVEFMDAANGCGESTKFEITQNQLRAILLEGGTGTYKWVGANGKPLYFVQMKKLN